MRKIIITIFLIALLVPFSGFAGEVYVWIDDNGTRNITTTPPEKNAKIIDRITFKEMTPEERQIYEHKQRLDQLKYELQDAKLGLDTAVKEKNKENARRKLDDLKVPLDRYKRNLSNARNETDRLFWTDEIRKIERDISDNVKVLEQ